MEAETQQPDPETLTGEALRNTYLDVVAPTWGWTKCCNKHCQVCRSTLSNRWQPHWHMPNGLGSFPPPFHINIGLALRELISNDSWYLNEFTVGVGASGFGILEYEHDGSEVSICEAILRCLLKAHACLLPGKKPSSN